MTLNPGASSLVDLLAAPLFVLLWSTGFIGAKYGLPYAEPLTFLSVRFAIAGVLIGLWVFATRAAWPSRGQVPHLLFVGALLHGVYLGGVFTAIWLGVEAGVSALIVSMQPILSAVLARWWLGERMTAVQWFGLALGFGGVALVVQQKIGAGVGDWRGLALCLAGLVAISVATLHQKKHLAGAPMRAGTAVQYLGALCVVVPLSLTFETREIAWTGDFVFALGWLVLVLSIGAVGLLMVLIGRGAASKVASLFFLVPPCTAVIAWLLFGETLGPVAILGVVLAVSGVALVMRGGRPPAEM